MEENQCEIVDFCRNEDLVLLADEVKFCCIFLVVA
jgi:hypothetical protein